MDETHGKTTFRREHPVFFWGVFALMVLLLAGSAVVGSRVPRYRKEAAELSRRMTEAERATRDRILESKAKRSDLAVALLKRDVRIRQLQEKGVHLAIDTQDSTLSLMHGVRALRTVKVAMGPDSLVRAPDGRQWRFVRALGERRLAEKQVSPTYTVPEWVYVSRGEPVPPEAERRIEGGLGRYVLKLDDGTEIYSEPEAGPLKGVAKPASFMARPRDLAAMFDALREDTPVYIY
jgi:hypothetical protein